MERVERTSASAGGRWWLLGVLLLAPGCALLPSGHTDACAPRSLIDQSIACFERGNAAAAAEQSECVEHYFQSARWAWYGTLEFADNPLRSSAAWRQYHTAVERFVASAQQFGRYEPGVGIHVVAGEQPQVVPLAVHGFAWQPEDFQRLELPPVDRAAPLSRRHRREGRGVPLVVAGTCQDPVPERRFLPQHWAFSATAILRFDDTCTTLELYNPLAAFDVALPTGHAPLAADLTAGLSAQLDLLPAAPALRFLRSGGSRPEDGLLFLEPYQAGKIPLIYVHGLLSGPESGADLANDLRAIPGLPDHYQIWMFRYATEEGLLRTAARLREELDAVLTTCDPAACDPALRQMVIVGHSMGGLVAKLQVTASGEEVWNALAHWPIEWLNAPEHVRSELLSMAYFDPHPQVARVIFIATPHRGVVPAATAAGRMAALLRPATRVERQYAQLVRDNPGAFRSYVARRLPTSVDVLEPDSPLLRTVWRLPVAPHVRMHSIYGESHPGLLTGPTDGVVPVASARHPSTDSDLSVPVSHSHVQRHPDVAAEVARILAAHVLELAESDQSLAPAQPAGDPATELLPAPLPLPLPLFNSTREEPSTWEEVPTREESSTRDESPAELPSTREPLPPGIPASEGKRAELPSGWSRRAASSARPVLVTTRFFRSDQSESAE